MKEKTAVELEEAKKVYKEAITWFGYLHDRWQDEKQYEDFKEYRYHAMKKIEKAGMVYLGMTKKPFAVKFRLQNGATKFFIVATSRNIKLQFQEG